ncbi:MAG: type II toxin-antitoxin system VapB family antitoxin [bacterium]|nr:type II toxin-antitoxin system VapB family antitoxin [bacterium]
MKRTNLVLPEDVLEETLRLSGERTYSKAVTRALEDFVRRAKARKILELRGSGLWRGELAEMRGDQPKAKRAERASS